MPLYEYQCLSCEKIHEIMQRFSDSPLEECPDCKGKIKKLISLSSFSLKGTGWYVTDYKKGSPTTAKPVTPPKSQETPAAQQPASAPSAPSTPAPAAAPASSTKPSTSGNSK